MNDELFIDEDGDACLSPPGRSHNLVALPARDENGDILNPEAWSAMVDRFNAHAAASACIAALEAERDDAIAESVWNKKAHDSLRTYVEALETALRPFSEALDNWPEEWPEDANNVEWALMSSSLKKADFIAARAAFAAQGEKQ